MKTLKKLVVVFIFTMLITCLIPTNTLVIAQTIDGWEWVDDQDERIVYEGEWGIWPEAEPNRL